MAFVPAILFGLAAGSGLSVVSNPINVATNRALPVLPENPNQLVTNLFRGQISQSEYFNEMLSNGFDQRKADLIADGQKMLLNAAEYLTLFRRGLLGGTSGNNKSAYLQHMSSIGFDNSTSEQFIQSQEVIESPSQIITFLVREVLNSQLRQELELDKEFPENSLADFAKIGIREELARRIWAAHWELPDVGIMQTALHRYSPENRSFWNDEVTAQGLDPDRVQTSIQDISQLLKFKDVGTKYREQVLSTLFNDAGQIQLRWLIRFRFLGFNEAVYRHERQGLPKVIAEQITKVVFVVQSITDWKTGISKGAITFDDVLAELQEWHITEENIIRIVKLKVADDIAEGVKDERKLSKGLIFDAFDIGKISRTEAITGLEGLNYSEDQSKFMFEVHEAEAELKKEKQARRGGLTNSEIKKAFRSGKLTQSEAIEKLQDNGKTKEAATIIIQIESEALAK